MPQRDLNLVDFREQITTRVLSIYTKEICSVFVDRNGLLDVWIATKVETTLWGPDIRQTLIDAHEFAIQQEQKSHTRLKAAE